MESFFPDLVAGKTGGVLYYSKNSDRWFTPLFLVERLGEFDLDPCGSNDNKTARRIVEENGLTIRWKGRVWLNPPYSQAKAWVEKLARHQNGIALLAARPESLWFQEVVWDRADAMLFLAGRLRFSGRGAAPFPSVLVAYGSKNTSALLQSGLPGAYITSWKLVEKKGDGRVLLRGGVGSNSGIVFS